MNGNDELEKQQVDEALARVLASPTFVSAPSLQKFLTYVVEEKLAGRGNELKAYTIALDALGKDENFDAQLDPSVRVLAGRLRSALNEYYRAVGALDPVEISVPLGGYRPQFATREVVDEGEEQPPPAQGQPPSDEEQKSIEISEGDTELENPSLANRLGKLPLILFAVVVMAGAGFFLLPTLQNYFSPPVGEQLGIATIKVVVRDSGASPQTRTTNSQGSSLAHDFRQALAKNKGISVILPPEATGSLVGNASAAQAADFFLDTNSVNITNGRRLLVSLINGRTNVLVWSGQQDVLSGGSERKNYEEAVGRLTRDLHTQIFGASIKALEARDPKTLTANQLFVLATWIPGPARNSLEWETERIRLARLALKKDPNFGPAYSVLADKLAYLAAVDGPSDTKEAAAEARESAQRALELSASDVNALFNVAQYYWHSGQVNQSVATMKRILEIDPNHAFARFFATVSPYTCEPAPQEVVDKAIAFDESLGADNPARWVTLTWLGWLHLNRDELSLALSAEQRAAQVFQIPYTVMRHAAVLNELGRTEEAAKLIVDQRKNWPNINPRHFARVTMPRLCSQIGGGQRMLAAYKTLARDTLSLLPVPKSVE